MDFFIARQPVFNYKMEVYGYELLYRSSEKRENAEIIDGDIATAEVITNTVLEIGFDTVTRGRKAFVNFTKALLDKQMTKLLPKDFLVVEILESVEPDIDLLKICQDLKAEGYLLALDDFVFKPEFRPILDLADIVKVDFLLTQGEERKELIKKINNPSIIYLAERVETHDDYAQAMADGYRMFQGYFFQKPLLITGKKIMTTQKSMFRIIQEINRNDIDFKDIEEIIRQDAALSFKLLKFMNSVTFGFKSRIKTINQAITLLGINEIKRWVALLALQDIANSKPEELLISSVVRAAFCEELAKLKGFQSRAPQFFLAGLLSQLDVILDMPIIKVVESLPLSENVKHMLMCKDDWFCKLIKLLDSYERNESAHIARLEDELALSPGFVNKAYITALRYSGIFSN